MSNPTSKHQAFTFIEMMVVILLIAGLSMFALPRLKETQKRQKALVSGQNLKMMNSAVNQWSVDNFGPPNAQANAQASGSVLHLIPDDGSDSFCQALLPYISYSSFNWYSPQAPNQSTYVYATWQDSTNNMVRAAVFSRLDSDSNYEPTGYESNAITIDANIIKACYANGYEDAGLWWTGAPRVHTSANSLDTQGFSSFDNYP